MKIDESKISIWHPAAIISTVLSIGRIPFAPGTWGSLFGVLVFPAFLIVPVKVAQFSDQKILPVIMATLVVLAVLYFIGIFAIKKYQARTGLGDASEIVYDELFGQILTFTMIGAFFIFWNMHIGKNKNDSVTLAHSLVYQFVPFIFFRLFDITKPWPIRIIDRKYKGANGVMLDDVLAAVFAAVASVIVFIVIDNNFSF